MPAALDANPRAAIHNLLVMTDFSDASNAALAYGADLARRSHAILHVAHMVWVPACQMEPGAAGTAYDWMLRAGADQLGELDRRDDLRDLPHRVHLERADIEIGLAGLVSRESIDLIVLGSNGRQGLDKAMLGSVAEEVFRHAACPVLTLGPRSWAGARATRGIGRILLATDFGAASRAAEAFARELAAQHEAGLVCLHVVPADSSERQRQDARAHLAQWVARSGTVRERREVAAGEPAATIAAVARGACADLVVLGAHRPRPWTGRTGWATAYEVVCEAICPVLTVRG